MKVSYFKLITDTNCSNEIDIDVLLERIQKGDYQDQFFKVSKVKDKEERQKLKAKILSGFTTSGVFTYRSKNGLKKHSGLIAIDIDNIDNLNEIRAKLNNDLFTFATFQSVSGNGLCVIIKINPTKHLETFLAIEQYYFETYGIEIDRSCKDVSRFRYVSYDPELYHNPDSQVFKKTKKEVAIPKEIKHLHTEGKFSRVMQKINTDIAPDYHEWINVGFAIASEFGEEGRNYFHHVSSFSSKYNQKDCDDKYTSLLRSNNSGVTIATFYYYCKRAGIETSTPNEHKTEVAAYLAKKQGRSIDSVKKVLELQGIEPDLQHIEKVYKTEDFNPLQSNEKGAKLNIDEVENWLRTTYDIRKNEITRTYEMNGKPLETENLNSIYIAAKKMFDKLSRELWDTILYSENTPTYNPIEEYLKNLEWDGVDRITMLSESINSETGTNEFRSRFLKKWLIGIVYPILKKEPNILMLVLAGKKQGTGKSTFFNRLLPKGLQEYFAVSQLDNGTDDKILLTQKLLILDDEYSGKSKKDSKHMKYVLSANQFDLREPYGKKNVRLAKIASLCGTTNDVQILNDPTGNRRIIVFEVVDNCDFKKYNKCDKEQLFAQVVHLVEKGESPDLSAQDVIALNQYTEGEYSESCIEKELLLKFFMPGKQDNPSSRYLTASEIKVHIERETNQKLYHKRLGMELTANNFVKTKTQGLYKYFVADAYYVDEVEEPTELPF
jgi:predicted P-loop ATPase